MTAIYSWNEIIHQRGQTSEIKQTVVTTYGEEDKKFLVVFANAIVHPGTVVCSDGSGVNHQFYSGHHWQRHLRSIFLMHR